MVPILDSKTQTFEEIMGNGSRYTVPPYQRDYSWEAEQWEDLWNDINSALQNKDQHYMGYVVIQTTENKIFKVIDGQQRLTTLSIIILAALKRYKDLINAGDKVDENAQRAKVFRDKYVGFIDPVSLQTDNKLTLNRNNKREFKSLTSNLEVMPSRGVSRTNKLLNDSFDFFFKKVKDFDGEKLAEFLETFATALFFTKITVSDDLNAYKVFETLNARGVKLSTPDLLKNYLFSTIDIKSDVAEGEIQHLDEQWEDIITQLGKVDFSKFLRADWNSKYPLATQTELFKKIRTNVFNKEKAYSYLHDLTKEAPIFAALNDPNDSFWDEQEKYREVKNSLECLRVFSIIQPQGIFLSAYNKFEPEEFVKLSKYIEILSLRYNVICNNSPNEQERAYNTIAQKISSGEHKRASHVKNDPDFKKLYPTDEDFKTAFKLKNMPSKQTPKKIKFILSEIENSLLSSPMERENSTLEHVLPYNPTSEWQTTFGDDWYTSTDRLGNMILLSTEDNKKAARLTFDEKKDIFISSKRPLAEQVATYDTWNKNALNSYQEWLANHAVIKWKIDWQ